MPPAPQPPIGTFINISAQRPLGIARPGKGEGRVVQGEVGHLGLGEALGPGQPAGPLGPLLLQLLEGGPGQDLAQPRALLHGFSPRISRFSRRW